jgi:hypothetical protein
MCDMRRMPSTDGPRDSQQQTDMLYFQWLMDTYGPDLILTWWRNCVAIQYGHTLPSPGTRTDPRR